MVSDKGKVLEDGLMTIGDGIIIIDSSPVISAVPGETVEFQDNDDLGIIKNVLTLLESNELSGITSIDVSNHSNIKLVYKERVTVLLGLSSSVNDKMDFVKAALTRLDSDNPDFTGSIDFTIDKKHISVLSVRITQRFRLYLRNYIQYKCKKTLKITG